MQSFNFLFIGDIVGSSGRSALKKFLPSIKQERNIHFTVANAENAAHGFGLTPIVAEEIFQAGVDVLTGGNHSWDKKEIETVFSKYPERALRPSNYPPELSGKGFAIAKWGRHSIGIVNLMGRVFMDPLNCPFHEFDRIHETLKKECSMIFVDFHAEATSEKAAMAWYLDGKVSCISGTHTHVQTADERILPRGTGFLSDAGMTGPYDSIIGMKTEIIVQRFLKKIPIRMEVAEGRGILQGVIFQIDPETGRCLNIERVRQIDGDTV
jgi:metallophosphoesterase (TIGR00282 family)